MAYVYRHIRLDKNEPFYIGIGSDLTYERANSTKGRNYIWNKISNKTEYRVDIVMDNLTWEEACEKEKELILLYGRKSFGNGILSNLTSGGEGIVGLFFTESHRAKKSLAQTGEKNHLYGKNLSEEHRKKISEANKIAWSKKQTRTKSESTKQKLSFAAKNRLIPNRGHIILNKYNGIFYYSIEQAAKSFGIPGSTLKAKLNGRIKNNTPFIFA
jgi:hypothetical protein